MWGFPFAAAAFSLALTGSPEGPLHDKSRSLDRNASTAAPNAFEARLWRTPGRVSSRNLFWGAGSRARQPRPPFHFREEDTGGTQPKVVIADARGVVWDVKFGEEVHAEIAANRLTWALGYLVEEVYFVREGRIKGVRALKRARPFVDDDGTFRQARFKRRDPRMTPHDAAWSFHDNPFSTRRELSGLKILMTLINNWDIEGPRNNRVFEVIVRDGHTERWYMVSDLGGAFGKMGGRLSRHSKWDLEGFRSDGFIKRVAGDKLVLDYAGIEHGMSDVPLEHARWFADLASQLTRAQLRAGFQAAGASALEADGFSRSLMDKITALHRATRLSVRRAVLR